jgi:hypothetical protein
LRKQGLFVLQRCELIRKSGKTKSPSPRSGVGFAIVPPLFGSPSGNPVFCSVANWFEKAEKQKTRRRVAVFHDLLRGFAGSELLIDS